MISFIKVLDRTAIGHMCRHKYVPYESWHLISIHTYGDDRFISDGIKKRLRVMGCHMVLSLRFADISDTEYETAGKPLSVKLFDIEQAKNIIDFLNTINARQKKETLVVHCDAGISRSGGVATFACDYFGLNYKEFRRSNPQVRGNYYVIELLRDASGQRLTAETSAFAK